MAELKQLKDKVVIICDCGKRHEIFQEEGELQLETIYQQRTKAERKIKKTEEEEVIPEPPSPEETVKPKKSNNWLFEF